MTDFRMDVLAEISTTPQTRYLVGLDDYQGSHLCNVRVGRICRDGGSVLTPKGLSFQAKQLPAMIEALQRAQAEAERRGWLEAA